MKALMLLFDLPGKETELCFRAESVEINESIKLNEPDFESFKGRTADI